MPDIPASDFVLDPELQAVDPKLRQAIDYWSELRGQRLAPSRAELSPRAMKSFLPYVQIFDVLDEGKAYRPRLMGTAIVAQINEDTTGQLFDASSPRPVVHRVLRALAWMLENRRPLRTFATRTAIEGRDHVSHETVFLPLSSDGATIDMVMLVGAFAPVAH